MTHMPYYSDEEIKVLAAHALESIGKYEAFLKSIQEVCKHPNPINKTNHSPLYGYDWWYEYYCPQCFKRWKEPLYKSSKK